MTWYLWLIVGFLAGIIVTAFGIMAFAYVVMHSPKLQAVFMKRIMQNMMGKARPQ